MVPAVTHNWGRLACARCIDINRGLQSFEFVCAQSIEWDGCDKIRRNEHLSTELLREGPKASSNVDGASDNREIQPSA